MHGRRSPRADIVIWETPEAKSRNRTPVLVVECKAEKVDINFGPSRHVPSRNNSTVAPGNGCPTSRSSMIACST